MYHDIRCTLWMSEAMLFSLISLSPLLSFLFSRHVSNLDSFCSICFLEVSSPLFFCLEHGPLFTLLRKRHGDF